MEFLQTNKSLKAKTGWDKFVRELHFTGDGNNGMTSYSSTLAPNCILLEIETMGWPATKSHCDELHFYCCAKQWDDQLPNCIALHFPSWPSLLSRQWVPVAHCTVCCTMLIAQRGHYTTHHTSTRRHCKILCVNCKLLKTAPLWATRGTLHIVLYRAHVAQAQNYKTILYFISSTGQIMTWNHWRPLGILCESNTLYVQIKC